MRYGRQADNGELDVVLPLRGTRRVRPWLTVQPELLSLWFNARRLHSSLGNIPPVEHEQRHVAALAANPEALSFPARSGTLNAGAVYDPFGVVSDLRNQTIALTR